MCKKVVKSYINPVMSLQLLSTKDRHIECQPTPMQGFTTPPFGL